MRKIGIIYGGRSTEHDASLKSKENFFKNLDKDQFDIVELIFVFSFLLKKRYVEIKIITYIMKL